jgi:lipoprotein-anchoring transpeptidase ErfK/SrfK
MRTLALVAALALSLSMPIAVAAQSAGEASAPDPLAPLFAAADASPDGLAPLLLAASQRIGELDGSAGHALAERLAPYAARAFDSPETGADFESLGVVVHRVKKGEVPGAIARRYRIGDGLIARLNRDYAPTRLQVGQPLKLLDLSDRSLRLVVDRNRHRLGAWRTAPGGGWLLLAYLPVGLGAPETPTPSGSTQVIERARDPEWRDPVSGVVHPPGAPGNVLGGYWMRLDPAGIGKGGIGLHGYTAEDPALWLGRDASNGCVRLRQDDMDLVFHLALEGTPLAFVP